jgi:glyoxylase-like metal-dependent hydrolase (beta-lactamase superfamily II)/rhodanese-related sulfurtransferase
MYVEQLYTGCLAEAAYYIESNGEAAVVDPLRETEPYLKIAKERNAKIKYVFETHFHADFVSGHIDLAREAGSKLIFGPTATPGYASYVAEDGEKFNLGDVTIKVLHTPGHTMESTTYLLIDEDGKDHAIFTGDTLFIGDVGRPDLAIKSDLTQDDLAGLLYDSLHSKILPLHDDVIVYPGHGAGSQCGKNMSDETVSTIGHQRKFNYALQDLTKSQFIDVVTDGLAEPPKYFPENARINREGYDNIDDILERNLKALNLSEFENAINNGAVVLDTRHPDLYEKGSIRYSLNIGLDGQYAVWVGSLINIDDPIVLITEDGKAKESILRLARVGFENVLGYLEGGINSWVKSGKAVQKIESIAPDKTVDYMTAGYEILDVRRSSETEAEHVEGALNIPLVELKENLEKLDKNGKYLVHCAGGYRSMVAASILKSAGINDILNVYHGFDVMKTIEGIPLVAGKCPNQLRKEQLETIRFED